MKWLLKCILIFCLSAGKINPLFARNFLGNDLQIKWKEGWSKVLCMKNGNTVLLHLDRDKPIMVFVFDTMHKQVAREEIMPRLFDITRLELMTFRGMFEQNGEVVLFAEQGEGRRSLVRVRINGTSGKLIDEKIIGESKKISDKTGFFVMNEQGNGYAILYCTDRPQFFTCEVHLTYFSNSHQLLKSIPLLVDRKNYDYMFVTGADARPEGICITLDLEKLVSNETMADGSPQRALYNHDVAMYYIAAGDTGAITVTVKTATDTYPNYTKMSYNPFAQSFNLLTFSYLPIYYTFGITINRGSVSGNLFFVENLGTNDTKLNYVAYKNATNLMKPYTLKERPFYGIPVGMTTNDNGLTTLVAENYERYDEPETGDKYIYLTYLGNVAITELDDLGNELWGTVIPHASALKSYKNFTEPAIFGKQSTDASVFTELPEQVYSRQFMSINNYVYKNNNYIILNDAERKSPTDFAERQDTIYNYNNTNAYLYTITSKKVITRDYVFGKPGDHEYYTGCIEAADFDPDRGIYATLVQHKKGDEVTLQMGWVYLD